MKRQVKIPAKVLASAKSAAARVAVEQPSPRKPIPPPHQPRKTLAREKVIAALKKLHPMD